jgi:hypothetical protein
VPLRGNTVWWLQISVLIPNRDGSTSEPKDSIGRPVNSGAMVDTDRRRLLAVGGAALLTGLAGCSLFDDTTGVPGREGDEAEAGSDGRDSGRTLGPSR